MKSFNHYFTSVTIFVPLLILFQLPDSYGQTAEQIAKEVFESTVLLVMEDANGQPTSLGSGFFVSNGIIASNLHVIENASRGYVRVIGSETRYNIDGITGIDSKRDLALLKISIPQSLSLNFGNSDAIQVGETVYAVGNPLGLEGTFSQGIISGIRNIGSDKLLQITAPISPGSSGGPVLNSNGDVIGISVATFSSGQNLNFAIPINYLKKLLDNSIDLIPLSDVSNENTGSSLISELGGRSSEGIEGTQFVWDSYVDYSHTFPYDGKFTFSLRNKYRDSVKNILCLIIFYDSQNQPLDVSVVRYRETIPSGLARRVSSNTDGSVQKLTTPSRNALPSTRIEFRILDFEIIN